MEGIDKRGEEGLYIYRTESCKCDGSWGAAINPGCDGPVGYLEVRGKFFPAGISRAAEMGRRLKDKTLLGNVAR